MAAPSPKPTNHATEHRQSEGVTRAAAPTRDVCDVRCINPEAVRRTQALLRPAPTTRTLAETFHVLGDPTRLRIVEALSHGELCVCDLGVLVGASQSVVSHSLRGLRRLRLVRYRRDGKVAYYALDDAHIVSILAQGLGHVEERAAAGRTRLTADGASPRRARRPDTERLE